MRASNVVDLMAALKKSLGQAPEERKVAPAKKAAKKAAQKPATAAQATTRRSRKRA